MDGGDFSQDAFLMQHIAFDRIDQVADQVMPPLQLDINTAPCFILEVPQADQAVADNDIPDDQDDEDDCGNATDGCCVHGAVPCLKGVIISMLIIA